MIRHLIDPGARYGEWTVLRELRGRRSHRRVVLVRCSCGGRHYVLMASLTSGTSTRCYMCGRASAGNKLRRTAPWVCAWCGQDYTDAMEQLRERRSLSGRSAGPRMAAECPTCNRRATRNGRCAEHGFPIYTRRFADTGGCGMCNS